MSNDDTQITEGNDVPERTVVTKSDLADGKLDKVWPEGPSEIVTQEHSMELVASRPKFSVLAEELDAAKMMAMAGPFIPEFMRGNPGQCLAVIQLSKRWSKYDARTNSWISFDPIAIASCAYLVTSQDGRQTVGYTSQLIGAIVDAFVPLVSRMRYLYDNEGQDRVCTASAIRAGLDAEPFTYSTPPLKLITPKKSPLWQSDPDRQLAYYARRAWARLFTPGVLLGVYDVDELEGLADQRTRKVKDLADVEGLRNRLRQARDSGHGEEGFREGAVEEALTQKPSTGNKPTRNRAETGRKRVSARSRTPTAPKPAKRDKTAPKPIETRSAKQEFAKAKVEREPAKPTKPAKLPRNETEYADHVIKGWLLELTAEEAIEERWRTERNLRNACGVVEEVRLAIRLHVDQRIAELRADQ